MTTKADFTEDEWKRVRRAPFVAGMAISLADPGGPIEMSKETVATLKAATNPPSREELLADVALDLQSMAQNKKNPLSGFKLEKGSPAGQQVLDELRTVADLVAGKASAQERQAYGEWLVATAQAAADAAKEGGFMGFHAVRVSEGEQAMLDQLRQTLQT